MGRILCILFSQLNDQTPIYNIVIQRMKKQSSIVPVQQNQSWIKYISENLHALIEKSKQNSSSQIEIEFKYAHSQIHPKYQFEYSILKKISNQFPVFMNKVDFGYRFTAGFPDMKKFYFIRDYLKSISLANQKPDTVEHNYYKKLSNELQNKKIKFKQNQLRIDINDKSTGDRYTYTYEKGWERMKKIYMGDERYDILYCQREIRLTINQEKKQWSSTLNEEVKQILQKNKQKLFIRFKNISKFEKDEKYQISLSEVINANQYKNEVINEILEKLNYPQEMDIFLINHFANFYDIPFDWKNKSLEIQSEMTQVGFNLLKKYHREQRNIEFQTMIEIMLQDLVSLFHADYSIKIQQQKVIKQMYKKKHNKDDLVIYSRLQNILGGYMRDQMDNFMKNKSEQF